MKHEGWGCHQMLPNVTKCHMGEGEEGRSKNNPKVLRLFLKGLSSLPPSVRMKTNEIYLDFFLSYLFKEESWHKP